MDGLLEVHACQLLNDESDLKCGGGIVESCPDVVEWRENLKVKAVAGQLRVPRGLPSVQTFQENVLSYPYTWHLNYSFNQSRQLPYTRWSRRGKGSVGSLDR